MFVKLFDENHEEDLEEVLNDFLSLPNIEVVDIRYQLAVMYDYKSQVFCYSAMVLYNLKDDDKIKSIVNKKSK